MSFIHRDLENAEYIKWKEFLGQGEIWGFDEVKAYEISELKRILDLAYRQTPNYKKLFDEAGFNPAYLNNTDQIQNLPFITKEMIRDDLEGFSVAGVERDYVTTGGSSGIPMGMYRSKKAFAKELASKAHQYHRRGWLEGDRQMVFRGLPINTPDNTEFVAEFNELRCSTYQFIPERMESYRKKALDFRPEWIRCYPSSGYLFASFIEESNLDFPELKGILCASEMLYDFQKEKLERVFGCKVFSHYGHYELAALAGFCEYTDDYHVLPQYGFVELIDESGKIVDQPGEMGEIVATSFIMDVTPFIRYRTGDMALFKGIGCEKCGRPYQVWEKVIGRRQEYIVSNSGRLISMTMLNMHDDIYDDFRQYQFAQKEKGVVSLRYIPKKAITREKLRDIEKRLRVKTGNDIKLIFQEVSSLEITKRGKHKTLIQELDVGDKCLTLD